VQAPLVGPPREHAERRASATSTGPLTVVSLCCYLTSAAVGVAVTQQDSAGARDSSAIVGQIVARQTRDPLASAQVAVLGTERTTTADSSGKFTLTGLGPGTLRIEIRAVGYAPGFWRIPLTSRQVVARVFELDPLPYELPEVVVKGRQPLAQRRYADFERRRRTGMGYFLTQERIERGNPSALIDVLVTVRGVEQVCLSNDCKAKMVRSPPGCYPQYYLDGQESSAYFARNVPPRDVRGVEIYRGSSETPGEFLGTNSGCGVIAIWTKSSP
jgi:hypothetical protein